MINSKTVFIINTSDEPNNVIFSHASFVKDIGYTPCFVFPNRDNTNSNEDYYEQYKVLRLNFVFRTNSVFNYLCSLFKFVFYVANNLKKESLSNNILAIDLIGAIACVYLKFRGFNVNILVNDNFSARYKVPRPLFLVILKIEQWILRYVSNSCIFPDISRYILLGSPVLKRIDYIPNILNDDYTPIYRGSDSNKFLVMFCGWLHSSRGIELIESLLVLTTKNIEFQLVGFGDEKLLRSLCKHDRVKWLGHVTRKNNLDLLSRSDVNIAFYNPNILINRYALPQKVYDSLLVGCPVVLNSEVILSEDLFKSGTCFRFNYFDVSNLAKLLNKLSEEKYTLKDMSKRMRSYYDNHYSYAEVKNRANKIYSEILK